eukprot:gnl/Dysnectes_brevis/374_a416_3809.p1 GENE.gnl/Dysnectes_brevis/374_a416_3809~~gnl/Dysnectes_brevis/374_a416_3809.p1  ORF type:complete len:348 (+),score=75.46 gnl/Dysnectes_brevis/374_a416_3809:594-1637(+)
MISKSRTFTARLFSTVTGNVLYTESNNPWLNLAVEEYLLEEGPQFEPTLYLWRNEPVVVIGRNQNPYSECNLDAMTRDGVLLARRKSGGGAVYHDLGNTNFTLLSPLASFDKEGNTAIITSALAEMGIEATPSGRNDITVDGHKVSGSAYKIGARSAFHHGTLLMNVGLTSLGEYLTPSRSKLESKGIKSVRSRVANLSSFNSDVDHETLCPLIEKHFIEARGLRSEDVKYHTFTESELLAMPAIRRRYDFYSSWDFRFGSNPAFSDVVEARFDWGGVEIQYCVKGGEIRDVHVFSDCLDADLAPALADALSGCPVGPALASCVPAAGKDGWGAMWHDVVELMVKQF